MVRGRATNLFNRLLMQGLTYTVHSVVFKTRDRFMFRNIIKPFECSFNENTRVEAYAMPIEFPLYPKHVASFDDVIHPRTNRFLHGKFCLRVFNFSWYSIVSVMEETDFLHLKCRHSWHCCALGQGDSTHWRQDV